jgi:hypothetical protein
MSDNDHGYPNTKNSLEDNICNKYSDTYVPEPNLTRDH